MPQLSYTEEDVIQAMLDVTDNGLSQNQAAQKNGVPQTTLSDRLRGLPSRSEITQPAQILFKSQESRLVTWILRQEALGYAPSHSQVRATGAALLRQQGRERHIGVHCLARPASDGHRDGQVDSDHTPTTSRHIRDLGKNKSPSTRRRYSVISKGFEAQESKIASLGTRIASLEEEVGRLSRGKKRKAIPNPNKRFMALAEALVASDAISGPNEAIERADAVKDVIEVGGMDEDERSNSEEEELTLVRTRAGREVRIPRKY
ncbi:hypothetical protein ACKAV7_014702 [Fusarium commune]